MESSTLIGTVVRKCRTYSAQFKAQLVGECRSPGASVASVGRTHGINDNILHRWLREHELRQVGADQQTHTGASFIVLLPPTALKCWAALVRFADDGMLPIDNNWVENQIRPVALGRSNWLFAGSLRAGQRAAAVMSLVQSAKLSGNDPYAYLKDVLARLPLHPMPRIDELLPHRWTQR